MASSSNARKLKFDVFLSFSGEDTRKNFTSHLYHALDRKKIKTFIDDGLNRGEEIQHTLFKTIEESMISTIIFSENYGSSGWCLDEMVKILECRDTYGQEFLPIFFHLMSQIKEASLEINSKSLGRNIKRRCQGGGLAWRKQPQFLDGIHAIRGICDSYAFRILWFEILAQVNQSELHLNPKFLRSEAALVDGIVDDILKKLNKETSTNLKELIGIDSRIRQVKNLLQMELPDVRFIGIWGMSGIGKTTIAEAVFVSLSSQFEGRCFLKNIKEKGSDLDGLRDSSLSDILGEKTTSRIESVSVSRRLEGTKVLLVLDDVNDVDQIDAIIRWCNFGSGSRVIISSRDKQVLKSRVGGIYQVDGLNDVEALQLFSFHAFKNGCPSQDKMELANRVIKHAHGSPLALKVLGAYLFDKSKEVWESALSKLSRSPHDKIFQTLRLSFESLNDEEKSIFLDIACFFRGREIEFVKRILDGCGLSTDIGMSVLADKCFVSVEENKVEMHGLFQEMGHEIVRQESVRELGKRSRLWSSRDVYQVLTKNLGTESIEGIFFDTYKIGEVYLSSKAFVRMQNLRILQIYNSGLTNSSNVHLPHGLKFRSDQLRYLHWEGYPMNSMPSNFKAENLVELNLAYSNVQQLWTGEQNLANLKMINLSNSENLTSFPDLSKAKNLESMNFDYCTGLEEIPSSVRFLDKLIDWNMRNCTSLRSFPSGIKLLRSLKMLNFSGCSNLRGCPEVATSVTYLNLNQTAIEVLPWSIGNVNGLAALNLKDCKQLRNLPESLRLLKSLSIVDLSGCSSITKFPDISGDVRYLYLSKTSIEEIPSSIGLLSKLSSLNLTKCTRLKYIPSDISKLNSLETLVLSGCSSITKFPELSWNVKNLFLDGTDIMEIPSSIVLYGKLVELNVANCKRLQILPSSICMLKSLQKLNLSGCSTFENFPEILEYMRSLRYLYLNGTAVRKLPSPMENLRELSSLEMGCCRNLKLCCAPEIGVNMHCLRKLYLNNCCLLEMPDYLGLLSSLEALDLSGNDIVEIPLSIKELVGLQYLGLRNCERLRWLPYLPPRLTKLNAYGCVSLSMVLIDSIGVEGNIFEFLFTNCYGLTEFEKSGIMAYALAKFALYSKKLHNQMPSVPAGESSFCFPSGCHRNYCLCAITKCCKIQLPSQWAHSNFWGFVLQAVISSMVKSRHGFQVKCRYNFTNEYGDSHDLHCYFSGWYSEDYFNGYHLFVGFDPCVEVRKDVQKFNKYSEVEIEFCAHDMNGLPLQIESLVDVYDCDAGLLYSDDDNFFYSCPLLEERKVNHVESCVFYARNVR